MGLFKTFVGKVAGIPNLKFISLSIVLIISSFGLGYLKGVSVERASNDKDMDTAVIESKLDTVESATRADVKQEAADAVIIKELAEEKKGIEDAEATGSNPLDAIF